MGFDLSRPEKGDYKTQLFQYELKKNRLLKMKQNTLNIYCL